jgi:hypothetical protein
MSSAGEGICRQASESARGFSGVDAAAAVRKARYLEPLRVLEIRRACMQKLGTRIVFKLVGVAAKATA